MSDAWDESTVPPAHPTSDDELRRAPGPEPEPEVKPIDWLPRSRTRPGATTFGLTGRILLSLPATALTVGGWYLIVRYSDEPMIGLAFLFVLPITLVSILWLRAVWEKAPSRAAKPGGRRGRG